MWMMGNIICKYYIYTFNKHLDFQEKNLSAIFLLSRWKKLRNKQEELVIKELICKHVFVETIYYALNKELI